MAKNRTEKAGVMSAEEIPSVDDMLKATPRPDTPAPADEVIQKANLQKTLEFSQAIRDILDMEALMDFLIDRFVQILQAERGFLIMLSPDGSPIFKVSRTFEGGAIENPIEQVSHGVIQECARSGRAVLVSNALRHPLFEDRKSIKRLELLSAVCAPIAGPREGITGVIYLDNRSEIGRFGVDDADMLALLANQAGLAIENTRLFEKLHESRCRQKSLVGRIAREVNARFREALGDVLGQIQVFTLAHPGVEAAPELVTAMNKANRGIKLLQRFDSLAFERQEAALSEFSLKELLERCASEAGGIQPPEWDLKVDEALTLKGDRQSLRLAFSEVLRNAVEATRGQKARRVDIEAREKAGFLEVTIGDNGSGLGDEGVDRALEPFSSSKEKSLGIGLNVAETIFEAHQASLSLKSRRGRGAEVSVRFDKAQDTPAESPEIAGRDWASSVLVIDDQVELADLVGRTLAGQGHKVLVATSLRDGQKQLDSDQAWEIVMVDAGFAPKGLERLLKKVKSLPHAPKVILLAAWGDADSALHSGEVDLLVHKPLQLRTLPGLVREVLQA